LKHVTEDNLIIISAAFFGLRVFLAVVLQRVRLLLLLSGVARLRAQLLHLIPSRRAFRVRRASRAGLLRDLYALLHLIRYLFRVARMGRAFPTPTKPGHLCVGLKRGNLIAWAFGAESDPLTLANTLVGLERLTPPAIVAIV